LIQGIHYYRDKIPEDAIGLMHWQIGGANVLSDSGCATSVVEAGGCRRTYPHPD